MKKKKEVQPESSCNHKPRLETIKMGTKEIPNVDIKGNQLVYCPLCRHWGKIIKGKMIFA